MDGLGNVLGLIAAPYIPGPTIALISQVLIIFSITTSLIILNARYTYWQLFSAFLVLLGGAASVVPTIVRNKNNTEFFYAIIMASSSLPGALGFAIKEKVFEERKKEGLDIFIVNSHGSLFQLLFQPLFVPICIVLGATKNAPILDYIRNGFSCFMGVTPLGQKQSCEYTTLIYFIYVSINLTYNILLLLIVKKASALLSFIALKAIIPISIILFLFDWPFIHSSEITYAEIIGLIVILAGLVLYRYFTVMKEENKLGCCSCALPCLK